MSEGGHPGEVARGLRPGADGLVRCWWCGDDPTYVAYHDHEWGRPLEGESAMFERICLEAFQAGLSWLTILRKRAAFREAFVGFDPEAVARFSVSDVARLLADRRIVRNRRKIEAAVSNARALLRMQSDGTLLTELVWSHRPDRNDPPRHREDVPAQTPESSALARALKTRGFRFVGPTTCYATMQAAGVVNDHLEGCHARDVSPTIRPPGSL